MAVGQARVDLGVGRGLDAGSRDRSRAPGRGSVPSSRSVAKRSRMKAVWRVVDQLEAREAPPRHRRNARSECASAVSIAVCSDRWRACACRRRCRGRRWRALDSLFSVALSVMLGDARSAFDTGQISLALSAVSAKASPLDAGHLGLGLEGDPVMPTPASMVTAAFVRMLFGGVPRGGEQAGELHRVAAGMGGRDQLFRVGLAAGLETRGEGVVALEGCRTRPRRRPPSASPSIPHSPSKRSPSSPPSIVLVNWCRNLRFRGWREKIQTERRTAITAR